ncbi:calcineurin-like phosphoesterase [Diaporthe amygdali]|uniref:calcineurin-like phosphoesterase n=1 Tax=Phomopsis amygdali TaxID=1214568 RepID=UPI0022FE5B9D|nr:calcineurin-like phosphoesterase [Diaporthe amygdali]KAJ0119667.1 calcineurin-like phosphoesterase [Diaporthe amygdali]
MESRQSPQGSPGPREAVDINKPRQFSLQILGVVDKKIMAFFAFAAVLWLIAPSLQAVLPAIFPAHTSSDIFGPLKFRDDGTFQISIFEDLHFGENAWDSWGPQQDVNSVKVMNQILNNEFPQLVVLNGDLITGENTFKENSTTYVDQIVGPLVERNLTWASTYGNHDSDYNISREGILQRESLWPNSRTTSMVPGPQAGVTNYYLPVYPANCTLVAAAPCAPDLILWFFDSRGGHYYQQLDADGNRVGMPDWVDTSVVAWFQQTNAELVRNNGRVIPSLAFVHIPTNASQALQTEAGVDPNRQPGVNDDYVLAAQGQGWCADGANDGTCDYGGQDVPFMQAITTTKGLMGVFSGHDHGDTWCYKWRGILPGMTVAGNGLNLCFGQHSGYGGYGNWIRGSRQILVSREQLKDLAVETWIRTEAGTVQTRTLLELMVTNAACEAETDPKKLASRQLILTLAFIHTSVMTIFYALFDLLKYPKYIEPLREGILALVKDNGVDAVQNLSKHPAQGHSHRPPLQRLHLDPEVTFDGYRLYRRQVKMVQAHKDHLLFGYGRCTCPSRIWAVGEFKMILAKILVGMDFRPPKAMWIILKDLK